MELACNVVEFGDIMLHKLEVGIAEMVRNIGQIPGQEVVHYNNCETLCQKAIHQMGTQEPGSPGYQYTLFHRCVVDQFSAVA